MDRKRRYFLCLGGAALLVILLAGAGLCLGEMPLRQALDSGILWRLRLPRIATALLAGAALARDGKAGAAALVCDKQGWEWCSEWRIDRQ